MGAIKRLIIVMVGIGVVLLTLLSFVSVQEIVIGVLRYSFIVISLLIAGLMLRAQNISTRSRTSLIILGITFILFLPLFYGAKPFGISFPLNVMIVMGAVIVVGYFVDRFSGSPRVYIAYIQRIAGGDAQGVIAELENREKLNAPQMVALATAHTWLGNGEKAEAFARHAIEANPSYSDPKLTKKQRFVDMLTFLALADALSTQGRYSEALAEINRLKERGDRSAHLTLTAALWALLAGDENQARGFLVSIPSVTTQRGAANSVSVKYEFLYFYLQHLLLGMERRPDLHRMKDQLTEWEAEAARNAHNPYGQRLSEILADVRAVMEQ